MWGTKTSVEDDGVNERGEGLWGVRRMVMKRRGRGWRGDGRVDEDYPGSDHSERIYRVGRIDGLRKAGTGGSKDDTRRAGQGHREGQSVVDVHLYKYSLFGKHGMDSDAGVV